MKKTASVHLSMNVRVGSTIRVDARASINKDGRVERLDLTETATSQDGLRTDGSYDAGTALAQASSRIMQRLSEDLSSRGLSATAKEIYDAFLENAVSPEGVMHDVHGILDYIAEIGRHFFSEFQGDVNRQTNDREIAQQRSGPVRASEVAPDNFRPFGRRE